MDAEHLKKVLIESAIKVVYEKGLVGATTRAICEKACCNEVYIYRLFGGKEGLFKSAFTLLDKEIANCISYQLRKIDGKDAKQMFNKFFYGLWNFLIERKERCFFLIRYYHSTFFEDYSPQDRMVTYEKTNEKLKLFFKDDMDLWWTINQVYDLIFNNLGRIIKGDEKEERVRDRLCDLIYYNLQPYLKG